MVYGSHNSLTYVKARQWWRNMFHRCQSKTLQQQLEDTNLMMIDIRMRFDFDRKVIVTNGKWESEHHWDPEQFTAWVLANIRHRKTNVDKEKVFYINLTLDTDDVSFRQEMDFISLVNMFKADIGKNPNGRIALVGGTRTFDGERVVMTIPDVFVAFPVNTCSVQTKWYDKYFPRLFALRNNERNKRMWENENQLVAFDFV